VASGKSVVVQGKRAYRYEGLVGPMMALRCAIFQKTIMVYPVQLYLIYI